jgi:hypothetical protein
LFNAAVSFVIRSTVGYECYFLDSAHYDCDFYRYYRQPLGRGKEL